MWRLTRTEPLQRARLESARVEDAAADSSCISPEVRSSMRRACVRPRSNDYAPYRPNDDTSVTDAHLLINPSTLLLFSSFLSTLQQVQISLLLLFRFRYHLFVFFSLLITAISWSLVGVDMLRDELLDDDVRIEVSLSLGNHRGRSTPTSHKLSTNIDVVTQLLGKMRLVLTRSKSSFPV